MRNGGAALQVYSAIARRESGEDWLNIGLAIPHHDGDGFDIVLQALPLSPKLVVRKGSGEVRAAEARDTGKSVRDRLAGRPPTLKQQVEAFERTLIEQCLLGSGGKVSVAMELLHIPRRTLSEKMARLGIDRRLLINGASSAGPRNRSRQALQATGGKRRKTAASRTRAASASFDRG